MFSLRKRGNTRVSPTISLRDVTRVGTLLRTPLGHGVFCVDLSLVSLSDCVQLQSDNDQSSVPAGQGVCQPQRRHLGPRRHPEPTGGAGYRICRCFIQSLSYTTSFSFSSDVSSVSIHHSSHSTFLLLDSPFSSRPHCDAVEHRDWKVPPQISGPSRIR